ncbi:hypothetical protein BDV93DRAFT_278056 [Ceratobasidium sp. AG-I]|nr:hypothetical protein BDV93DRAFT_278056 [Ceratobasidium sp. AG-I]
MRLLAELEQGTGFNDELDSEDPQLLQEFYGIDGEATNHPQGTTGAGASPEDAQYQPDCSVASQDSDSIGASLSNAENQTMNLLRSQLQQEQEQNVRHPPIAVPARSSPFSSADEEDLYWTALAQAEGDNFTPSGYGVLAAEWEDGLYPEIEVIKVGKRRKGVHEIVLPCHVWLPRALRWARALHVLNYFNEV